MKWRISFFSTWASGPKTSTPGPSALGCLLLLLVYQNKLSRGCQVKLNATQVTSHPKFEDIERRDLTHLKAYAIDSEGIKDPDDAISCAIAPTADAVVMCEQAGC